MTYDRLGSEKSNRVASEVEVSTFQLVDKIETKSQRQFPFFDGPVILLYWLWCWSTKPEAENSRWRPLNSKYILPVTENICLTVEIVLPPYWIFQFRLHFCSFTGSSIGMAAYEIGRVAVEIKSLSCIAADIVLGSFSPLPSNSNVRLWNIICNTKVNYIFGLFLKLHIKREEP